MRSAIALVLLMTTTAVAERPTSATAAVDNLIADLIAKRYDAAAKALAKEVSLRNTSFRDACKKAFPKEDKIRSTVALAKCLASDVTWPDARIVATEIKTPLGWRVEIEGIRFNVRRTRDKKGYEVFSILLAGMADR